MNRTMVQCLIYAMNRLIRRGCVYYYYILLAFMIDGFLHTQKRDF